MDKGRVDKYRVGRRSFIWMNSKIDVEGGFRWNKKGIMEKKGRNYMGWCGDCWDERGNG